MHSIETGRPSNTANHPDPSGQTSGTTERAAPTGPQAAPVNEQLQELRALGQRILAKLEKLRIDPKPTLGTMLRSVITTAVGTALGRVIAAAILAAAAVVLASWFSDRDVSEILAKFASWVSTAIDAVVHALFTQR